MPGDRRRVARAAHVREWRERAACRGGVDPDLFFPAAESGAARDAQVRAAKAVCARCPVRSECLDEALVRIPYGIAGGLTERERQRLRRTHRAITSAPKEEAAGEVWAEGPRDGWTRVQRAGTGRALLAAGRQAGQVAQVCGVSTRTVQRWATSPSTTTHQTSATSTSTTGTTARARQARAAVPTWGRGAAAATGLPSDLPRRRRPGRHTSSGRTPRLDEHHHGQHQPRGRHRQPGHGGRSRGTGHGRVGGRGPVAALGHRGPRRLLRPGGRGGGEPVRARRPGAGAGPAGRRLRRHAAGPRAGGL